jgi:hypothetical protein
MGREGREHWGRGVELDGDVAGGEGDGDEGDGIAEGGRVRGDAEGGRVRVRCRARGRRRR